VAVELPEPEPEIEGGADGEAAVAPDGTAEAAADAAPDGAAEAAAEAAPDDTAMAAHAVDPRADSDDLGARALEEATVDVVDVIDALVDEGPMPGPSAPPAAAQLAAIAAPAPTPSQPATSASGTNVDAIAAAEAAARATTGNGEAMRPDATDDANLPIHPGPTRPESGAPAAAPGPVDGLVADGHVANGHGHVADGHVADMVAAVERLSQRARAADEALAAVAAEVEAFRAAQRRFDETEARRELRRRELEAFRDDVARLAREILGRVDGMFDAMAASDAAPEPNAQTTT
jgi:hypothetical protein